MIKKDKTAIKVTYRFKSESGVSCMLDRKIKPTCTLNPRTIKKICAECLLKNAASVDGVRMNSGALVRRQEQEKDSDGKFIPIRRKNPKIGRNTKCSCGSSLKYKQCCMVK